MAFEDFKRKIINNVNENELIELTKDLISIPSHWAIAEREKRIANYLHDLFKQENINVYLQEVIDGRSNVIATLKGLGSGPSLMLNGHIDTVPPFGMKDPFTPVIKNGCLYGRGSADMKSGIACMAYAMILIKRPGIDLAGDLVFSGVIDEDAASDLGTRYLIEHGPLTDYAIVGEATSLYPVIAHKGIDYFEIDFTGKSVHSSVPEKGVSAIFAAAEFASLIENYLVPSYNKLIHPYVGAPTINVDLIQGYAKANEPYLKGQSKTYSGIVPNKCKIFIDIRWTPYQSLSELEKDLKEIAQMVCKNRPEVKISVNYIPLPRPAMEIDPENQLVKCITEIVNEVLGKKLPLKGLSGWGDSGLFASIAKIPTIVFGPGDMSRAHSDNEFIDIKELKPASIIYTLAALKLCGTDR